MPVSSSISIKEINQLAFPAILSGIAEPLISLADTAMIGHFGTIEQGAVGVGTSLFLLIIWILTQTKTAISAIVSKHYGENKLDKIRSLIPQALLFNALLGLVVLVICYYWAPELIRSYKAKDDIFDQAVLYFRTRSFGFPIVLITYGIFGLFRGLQNTVWAMKISLTAGLINLVLNYFLIFGMGPLEPMGVRGAAIASLTSQCIMLLLALYFLLTKTQFTLHLQREINSQFSYLLKLSSGFIIRTIALNVAFYLSVRYATDYGDKYIAAHTIALNIWLFSSYFIDGYANAGNAIAGRLLGNKNFDLLYDTGLRLMKISVGIGFGLGFLYLLLYNILPPIFSKDPDVIRLFRSIFWILIISQPINAIAFSLDGIFKGLGRSNYLMITLLIAAFVGFVPTLLIADAQHLKLYGIWYAFVVFMSIRAGSLYFKFKKDFGTA